MGWYWHLYEYGLRTPLPSINSSLPLRHPLCPHCKWPHPASTLSNLTLTPSPDRRREPGNEANLAQPWICTFGKAPNRSSTCGINLVSNLHLVCTVELMSNTHVVHTSGLVTRLRKPPAQLAPNLHTLSPLFGECFFHITLYVPLPCVVFHSLPYYLPSIVFYHPAQNVWSQLDPESEGSTQFRDLRRA